LIAVLRGFLILAFEDLGAECKITAGHWPISNHLSKMANQIHEGLEKWPTISNFLFCTLWVCL